MGIRTIAAALALTLIPVISWAEDCTSSLSVVSQPALFPNREAGPVAWSGVSLGMAKNDSGASHAIFFALYDGNGNQISPDREAAAASQKGAITLLWTGSEFGLFYVAPNGFLTLQRVSAAGDIVGAPSALIPRPVFGTETYAIAWDSLHNRYVIAHFIPQGFEQGLWVATAFSQGATISDVRLTPFVEGDPELHLAAGPNGTMGLLFHHSGINNALVFLALDANLQQTKFTIVSTAGVSPQLGWNGTSFVVITRVAVTGGTEIRWSRLDGSGNLTANETRLLTGKGVDVLPLNLVWNPTRSEWAVGYSDSELGFNIFPGEYRLHRFTASGAVVSDSLFPPDATKSTSDTRYNLVWTGAAYEGPMARKTSSGSDSYLVRHCLLAATILADRTIMTTADRVTFTAAVTGGVPGLTYFWDFGDFETSTRNPEVHRYLKTGAYTVTLTVTDESGSVSTAKLVVNVITPKRRATKK